MADFKTEFSDKVTALIDDVKGGAYEDRSKRMAATAAMVDGYIAMYDETPDKTQLERLADVCLREELTDKTPWKSRNTEYPFFSEWQLDLKTRQDTKETASDTTATDGRDYRKPTRRQKRHYENKFIDRTARIRNKARRRKYNEFTREQPVVVRQVSPAEIEEYLREKYTYWQRKYAKGL
jgi:hypothetical protein